MDAFGVGWFGFKPYMVWFSLYKIWYLLLPFTWKKKNKKVPWRYFESHFFWFFLPNGFNISLHYDAKWVSTVILGYSDINIHLLHPFLALVWILEACIQFGLSKTLTFKPKKPKMSLLVFTVTLPVSQIHQNCCHFRNLW